MSEESCPVILRAAYTIEMPELWYLLRRETLQFGVTDRFHASLFQLADLDPDGTLRPCADTRFTFDCWFSVSTPFLEIVKAFPDEATFAAWRPEIALRELKPIPELPTKRGPLAIPAAFWRQLLQYRDELDQHALDTIAELCWRLGIHDGPSILSSDIGRLYVWPSDSHMRRVPVITTPSVTDLLVDDRHISGEVLKEILQMIETRNGAPLHHLLFQEAWRRRGAEPRVAIVMAIAATETATKTFVIHHLPDTRWLLENLQAPPIIQIIKKLVPTLPAINKIGDKVILPADIVRLLDEGVRIRNLIMHGRGKNVSSDTADSILNATRDFLALVDYYSGHDWALELVSSAARAALTRLDSPAA